MGRFEALVGQSWESDDLQIMDAYFEKQRKDLDPSCNCPDMIIGYVMT